MIRVLLVDDHREYLHSFQRFLAFDADITIVGTASNGQEALDVVAATQPDVVVMDIRMPVLDGVATTRCLRMLHPSCHVLLLTTWSDDEYVLEGIRAGARGYTYKDTSPREVAAAIHAVARGEPVVDPLAMEKVFRFVRHAPIPQQMPADDHLLSKQERKVLRLLEAGLSNQAIADLLGIVEPTVKTHVSHILDKLEVSSRTEAVQQARVRGLL